MASAYDDMPLIDLSDGPGESSSNSVGRISVSRSNSDHSDDSASAATDSDEFASVLTLTPAVQKREAQKQVFLNHIQASHADAELVAGPQSTIGRSEIKSEQQRLIEKAREYQQELFERAKEENVIAVLDTGSGKTLIACLLIRHMLEQEELRRATGNSQKIVFFLANSVHLVQQQGKVLQNNLIDVPKVVWGGSKHDLWKKETWNTIREHNKVVVCPPAILDQCLMHAFLNMSDISLLVFDEAHHAKKDHPYSRLIRSYYLKCPLHLRPRIFGMTASPVDSKGSIEKTAQALENLLHAKIITTDDLSILSFAPKPTDVKWVFDRLRPYFQTDLYREMWDLVSFLDDLKKVFEFAKRATTELGPWCADRAWNYGLALSTQQSSVIQKRYEQSKAYENLSTVEERQQRIKALDAAIDRVRCRPTQVPQLTSCDLSSKVLLLHEKLSAVYQANPDTRTIVFVNERLKAQVLRDVFEKIPIANLRMNVLLGISRSSTEGTSVKNQEQILEHFRIGLVNLVFATSVADEGLDVPQCNLCVRFDLCTTTIQYMQSRGRARMSGSVFANMIEQDNFEHNKRVNFQIEEEQYIKRWCATLPADRKLGQGTGLMRLLARDASVKAFETVSGAICDGSNCLMILSRFAASLAHVGATDKEIYEEEIDVETNLFRYTVRLPKNEDCLVLGCRGKWKPNKQLAKRSAAWACCVLLRKKQQLDQNLDSIYQKTKPLNANAHLAISARKFNYEMLVKPRVWDIGLGQAPTSLFACVVRFAVQGILKHKMCSIVFLTRTCLPDFPTFSVYLEDNVKVDIQCDVLKQPLAINDHQLDLLTSFTLQGMFADVFNKVYENDAKAMSYWLVPLTSRDDFDESKIDHLVDFESLTTCNQDRTRWTINMPHSSWTNKFLCDPLSGKFHYFTGSAVPGASIYDPVPETVPPIAQKRRENIIDFSDSHWTASRKRQPTDHKYDEHQPVVEADLVGTRRNYLESHTTSDMIPCLIAPQTLQIARIDADFAASCLVWPTIIHRLESYLIVLEAFDKLGLSGVPPELALEAFTKDAENEEEELQTHTGGKRGMGKNYERLEFIGDSLLKMTTTVAVFIRTKCDEEGMHCRRMEMLCNRRLYDIACGELKLFKHARTQPFNRITWYPENLKLISGRGAKKIPEAVKHTDFTQDLGMKTIADISEAIIGAAVITSQSTGRGLDLGIQAITKLVQSEDHDITSWSCFSEMYTVPEWSLSEDDILANSLADKIHLKTGYTFRHPRLLRSAFTHSSDVNSPVPDLQRLEFLGDAVFDWVCISWLFDSNPSKDPQWLTEHKMAMVSNKFLAALAVTLDFDKLISATTVKLLTDIETYAMKIREARAAADCSPSFWTEIERPPKALSDLVESYLGAVLVDSDFDYSEIESFFEQHVKQFFVNIDDYDSFANQHSTTFLHKKLGQEFKCQDYRILDSVPAEGKIEVEITAGVIVHNKVLATDKGTSAKYARVRASQQAILMLDGMNREQFRQKYSCNCQGREDGT